MKYNLSFAFIPSSHMDTPEHKKEIIQTKTNPEKLSSNTFVQKHGINMETTVTLVSGNNTFFAKMKKGNIDYVSYYVQTYKNQRKLDA